MIFYLGTHQPIWLERLTVPLFVSRRRLCDRKRLPRSVTNWCLDSGGFSELSLYGEWTASVKNYVAEARRYRGEIGQLQWASPMDWMCEPQIIARTGLTLPEHQCRTLENYRELQQQAPEMPRTPVLQGWAVEDYLRHWGQYEQAGISLSSLPVVGLGTVCRRQGTKEAARIVRALGGLRLHGFGFKTTGLEELADAFVSADSMAWSAGARWELPLPGCRHKSCANCERWASRWRTQLLERIEQASGPRQMALAL